MPSVMVNGLWSNLGSFARCRWGGKDAGLGVPRCMWRVAYMQCTSEATAQGKRRRPRRQHSLRRSATDETVREPMDERTPLLPSEFITSCAHWPEYVQQISHRSKGSIWLTALYITASSCSYPRHLAPPEAGSRLNRSLSR